MAQAIQPKPSDNHSDDAVDWVQVMLTIERPSPASLAGCTRHEKFDILLKNAERQRMQLLAWIQAHGLADEVLHIGPPTSLNLLFVQCTSHAAAELAHVPGIVDVVLEYELPNKTL